MGFVSMRKNFGRQMRVLMYVIFAIFVVSCAYYYGAYTTPSGGAPEGTKSTARGLMATVNGDKIDRGDFEKAFQAQYEQYEQMGAAPLAMLEFLRWQVLDSMVQQRLLTQAARRQGIEVSSRDVEQEIKRYLDRALKGRAGQADRRYRDSMERSLRQHENDIRDQLLVQRLQQAVSAQIKPTDAAVRDSYREALASHILFRVDPNDKSGRSDAEAKKKAQEVLAKLRAGGDFAALAKQYSQDQATAPKGGDLGWFSTLQMATEFQKAAFALQPGQISDLVKTTFGYHIIKLRQVRYNLPADFEQKKNDYRRQFVQQQQSRAWGDFTRVLRERAKIEIRDPEMLAWQAIMAGKTAEAMKYYQQALKSADKLPDQVRAAIYLKQGQFYGQANDWKKAVAMYESSLEAATTSLQEIYLALGEGYEKLGKRDKALEYYKDAEDEAPDDASVRQRLLTAYKAMGNTEAAARQQKWIDQDKAKRQAEMKKRMEELARQQAAQAQAQAGAGKSKRPTTVKTSDLGAAKPVPVPGGASKPAGETERKSP
jgi:foldase protein PrsA